MVDTKNDIINETKIDKQTNKQIFIYLFQVVIK
jgi:hypothetical protein